MEEDFSFYAGPTYDIIGFGRKAHMYKDLVFILCTCDS